MDIRRVDPPRRFGVGQDGRIELRHVADVELEPDEVMTFRTPSGSEADVTRKAWGYYWTGSLDRRLPQHGLHAALVRSPYGTHFVMLVETDSAAAFRAYCEEEAMQVVQWLDGR